MEEAGRIDQLRSAAAAALFAADYATMEKLARELIEVSVPRNDTRGRALGEHFLGNAYLQNGNGEAAATHYKLAHALYEELGDTGAAAQVLMNLGIVAVEINLDVAEARRLYEEALPTVRGLNEPRRLALALGNFGEISRLEGDYAQAMAYGKESYELFLASGDRLLAAGQLVNIAHCHTLQREYSLAIKTLDAAFVRLSQDQSPHWLAVYFDAWFVIATELGRFETAAQLLGFTDRFRDARKVPRLKGTLPWFLSCVDRLQDRVEKSRFAELRESGEKMSWEEAQALCATVTSETPA